MSGPISGSRQAWSAVLNVATGDTGTKTIQAAPSATQKLVVCRLNWDITTAAAVSFFIGDGTTKLFQSQSTPPVGQYWLDYGEQGFPMALATALSATLSGAGNGFTVTAWGYILDSLGG